MENTRNNYIVAVEKGQKRAQERLFVILEMIFGKTIYQHEAKSERKQVFVSG